MYAIIQWKDNDNYLDFIKNSDGGIRIFTLEEADTFANNHPYSDNMRVISLEGVEE